MTECCVSSPHSGYSGYGGYGGMGERCVSSPERLPLVAHDGSHRCNRCNHMMGPTARVPSVGPTVVTAVTAVTT